MKYAFPNSAYVLAFSLSLGFASAQEPTFPTLTQPEVVPGQFIVKATPGAELNVQARSLEARNFNVVETLPLIGAQIISFPGATEAMTRSLAVEIPGIEYIEPVYRVSIANTPNDPDYPMQWSYEKIKAPQAWDRRTDSGDVVVAVIDTGVDYLHPDITANMWTNPRETAGNGLDDDGNGIVDDVYGANFFPAATTGNPMDENRHGTHVAGKIGAVTDNSLGVAGVNWTTKIMALKFLDGDGLGTTAGAIRAIEYGIRMEADIMNNAWGGGGFSRTLDEAIQRASNAGILFVAAAGSNNNDNDAQAFYPANYDGPNVLAVMATDQNDNKAGFSNFGRTTVDLGAPGVDILSTVPGGGYAYFNGTSMATAHVAGAAALVLAEKPSLTVDELKKHLMETVDKIPALAGQSVTGGRLSLARALGGHSGPPPAPKPPIAPHVAASRIFAGPNQFPPEDFAAYGILAFPLRATVEERDRHMMICNAYIAAIPHASELYIPRSKQMVTVWPIDRDANAHNLNKRPRKEVCEFAVDQYGLVVAKQALKDAVRTGRDTSNAGPYLLAWSPSIDKGKADALVLAVNLSDVTTPEQAREIMLAWSKDIESNPGLWNDGWNLEQARIKIRLWVDKFGPDIMGLFGGN